MWHLHCGCAQPGQSSEKIVSTDTIGISYSKNDLNNLRWIQGKWKGMGGDKPFYEIYQLTNDSTLMITSYEWNGKDSSNSSVDFVSWKDCVNQH